MSDKYVRRHIRRIHELPAEECARIHGRLQLRDGRRACSGAGQVPSPPARPAARPDLLSTTMIRL